MPKYKNMYKIKKTQPTKRGNMQNLEGGKNVCLELLYAMMKRFLEMT